MQRLTPLSNQAIKITTIIFDFDLTISREHIHSFLTQCLSSRTTSFNHRTKLYRHENFSPAQIEEMWGLVLKHNKHLPTGDARNWRNIFTTLLDQGFHVVIASFSSFAPILKRFLADVIGLPETYLERIRIEAWLPNGDKDDKNHHLDRIARAVPTDTPISIDPPLLTEDERKARYKSFILIDDSFRNINAVERLTGEQHVILVKSGDEKTPERIIHLLNQRLGVLIPQATQQDEATRPSTLRP